MEIASQLMKKAEIYPKLRLGIKQPKGGVESTGPQRVKLVKEMIRKGMDRDSGQVIEVYKIIVEHEGHLKEYRMPVKAKETGELHYLIQRLSRVAEGEEIILEMKKQGPKNYVEVLRGDGSPIEVDDEVADASSDADEDISDEDIDDAMDSVGIN